MLVSFSIDLRSVFSLHSSPFWVYLLYSVVLFLSLFYMLQYKIHVCLSLLGNSEVLSLLTFFVSDFLIMSLQSVFFFSVWAAVQDRCMFTIAITVDPCLSFLSVYLEVLCHITFFVPQSSSSVTMSLPFIFFLRVTCSTRLVFASCRHYCGSLHLLGFSDTVSKSVLVSSFFHA